jgi:hypothetical protein
VSLAEEGGSFVQLPVGGEPASEVEDEVRTKRLVIVDDEGRERLKADVRDGVVCLELVATGRGGRSVKVTLWADEGDSNEDVAAAGFGLARGEEMVRESWVSDAGLPD